MGYIYADRIFIMDMFCFCITSYNYEVELGDRKVKRVG